MMMAMYDTSHVFHLITPVQPIIPTGTRRALERAATSLPSRARVRRQRSFRDDHSRMSKEPWNTCGFETLSGKLHKDKESPLDTIFPRERLARKCVYKQTYFIENTMNIWLPSHFLFREQ
jgi:hypothetical protein